MKKYLVLFMVILLTGCSAPGTALLGPAFTGATTKSVARASLSFGTNQIMKKVDINEKKSKIEVKEVATKIDNLDLYSHREKLFHFSK